MLNIKENTRFTAVPANGGPAVRCYREKAGTVFVFAKGKRNYGRRYSDEDFLRLYTPKKQKRTETEEWHRRLERAIRCMRASGLWPEIMRKFQDCLEMTAEDHRMIRSIYMDRWEIVDGKHVLRTEEEQDARLKPYVDKYPFLFSKDGEGHTQVDTGYIFETSDCRLKSMYFGRQNKDIKCELQAAINDKRPWSSGRIRAGYDVSVEYEPDKQKAWYSEEYRNCGNGHYVRLVPSQV